MTGLIAAHGTHPQIKDNSANPVLGRYSGTLAMLERTAGLVYTEDSRERELLFSSVSLSGKVPAASCDWLQVYSSHRKKSHFSAFLAGTVARAKTN